MSNTPNHIPTNAIKITCHYEEFKGQFHIWPVKSFRGVRWVWSAYGISGEEATQELAIQSGRDSVCKVGQINKGEVE